MSAPPATPEVSTSSPSSFTPASTSLTSASSSASGPSIPPLSVASSVAAALAAAATPAHAIDGVPRLQLIPQSPDLLRRMHELHNHERVGGDDAEERMFFDRIGKMPVQGLAIHSYEWYNPRQTKPAENDCL